MDIKSRILEMNKVYCEKYDLKASDDIDDLLIALITKFQLFEPCSYVSEDEDWITFIIVPQDESLGNQIMTLRKDEIISYGICNEKNISADDTAPKNESESLYQ